MILQSLTFRAAPLGHQRLPHHPAPDPGRSRGAHRQDRVPLRTLRGQQRRCARIADRAYFYDNTPEDRQVRLVFRCKSGVVEKIYGAVPLWTGPIRAALSAPAKIRTTAQHRQAPSPRGEDAHCIQMRAPGSGKAARHPQLHRKTDPPREA